MFPSGSNRDRRIDRAEEAAGDTTERPRFDKPGGRGEAAPARLAERMGHPGIAPIGVVLDDHETPTWSKVPGEPSDHRNLSISRHEMQAVGRDQRVQRRAQVEPSREVRNERLQVDRGKARRHRVNVCGERAGVPIDRNDPPAWSEQVGQGHRERTSPGPDIGPRSAWLNSVAEQRDMIGVIHPPGSLARALETRGDPVDRELDQPKHAVALGVVR
jgi:hypothetical protein